MSILSGQKESVSGFSKNRTQAADNKKKKSKDPAAPDAPSDKSSHEKAEEENERFSKFVERLARYHGVNPEEFDTIAVPGGTLLSYLNFFTEKPPFHDGNGHPMRVSASMVPGMNFEIQPGAVMIQKLLLTKDEEGYKRAMAVAIEMALAALTDPALRGGVDVHGSDEEKMILATAAALVGLTVRNAPPPHPQQPQLDELAQQKLMELRGQIDKANNLSKQNKTRESAAQPSPEPQPENDDNDPQDGPDTPPGPVPPPVPPVSPKTATKETADPKPSPAPQSVAEKIPDNDIAETATEDGVEQTKDEPETPEVHQGEIVDDDLPHEAGEVENDFTDAEVIPDEKPATEVAPEKTASAASQTPPPAPDNTSRDSHPPREPGGTPVKEEKPAAQTSPVPEQTSDQKSGNPSSTQEEKSTAPQPTPQQKRTAEKAAESQPASSTAREQTPEPVASPVTGTEEIKPEVTEKPTPASRPETVSAPAEILPPDNRAAEPSVDGAGKKETTIDVESRPLTPEEAANAKNADSKPAQTGVPDNQTAPVPQDKNQNAPLLLSDFSGSTQNNQSPADISAPPPQNIQQNVQVIVTMPEAKPAENPAPLTSQFTDAQTPPTPAPEEKKPPTADETLAAGGVSHGLYDQVRARVVRDHLATVAHVENIIGIELVNSDGTQGIPNSSAIAKTILQVLELEGVVKRSRPGGPRIVTVPAKNDDGTLRDVPPRERPFLPLQQPH